MVSWVTGQVLSPRLMSWFGHWEYDDNLCVTPETLPDIRSSNEPQVPPCPASFDSVAAPVFIKVNPPRQFLLLTQHPHDLIKILANILCQAINPLTSVWNSLVFNLHCTFCVQIAFSHKFKS